MLDLSIVMTKLVFNTGNKLQTNKNYLFVSFILFKRERY